MSTELRDSGRVWRLKNQKTLVGRADINWPTSHKKRVCGGGFWEKREEGETISQ